MKPLVISHLYCFLFFSLPLLNAQETGNELFIPSEVKAAYEKGTRSPDGQPGPNYWQNHARYDIDVRLEPEESRLYGTGTISYINNSPDALRQVVVRLHYDVYKAGSARDEAISEENVSDGVQLDYVTVDGMEFDLENRGQLSRNGTNLMLNLPSPLEPGDSLSLNIGWDTQVPFQGIRTGAYDSTTFFVGYWYPQVAVYDDIFGWDTESYTGQVEFYSDLADFDVRIKMPPGFLVHATGELQNEEAVLPTEILSTYRESKTSDETHVLISEEQAEQRYLSFGGEWHFKARNVPDFAFFTSDHFIWEASSLEVDGRRVRISTLYPSENAAAYQGVTQIQRKAMDYFSNEVSGVPYPYLAYASINTYGGGGMEFPMMANNAAPDNEWSMASLTAHEMHHMYFPFYVRINEKRYAWMDEGWADYITDLALGEIYGEDYTTQANSNVSRVISGERLGDRSRMPLITPSFDLRDGNYGYMTYMYAHYSYKVLHEALGDETFRKCFREYISRWAYKSPTPYDFFNTFEDVSGQDLDWFWGPWYFSFGAADVALAEMNGDEITVTRKGSLPTTTAITVFYEDGSTEDIVGSPAIWKDGKTSHTFKASKSTPISRVTVNAGSVDLDIDDNILFSKAAIAGMGDLKRFEGIFQVNPSVSFDVIADKDKLLMKVEQLDFEATLFKDGPTSFSTIDETVKARFREDGEGNLGFLTVDLFGNEVDARKVE